MINAGQYSISKRHDLLSEAVLVIEGWTRVASCELRVASCEHEHEHEHE
jgi:hypothetical protein